MERIQEKLSIIGESIREKTGKTELLSLDEMPAEIAAIETGIKTDDATAVAGDILSGKTAYAKDVKITGTIPTKTQNDLTVNGATITVPSGYYNSQVSKSVTTTTQAVPSISINNNGLITASTTQTAGYVTAGTKSATKQLTTKAAATITPSTSNQTIAAGTYLTGAQTIAGDADLVAGNIKKGVNIFGVNGNYTDLNFSVVGGTSAPSSPSANTIWVNTSTTITSYIFSATQPTGSTGMVWISIGTSSSAAFNALKKNGIQVYPISAKQYISGAWVYKAAKSYQNGKWFSFARLPSEYQEVEYLQATGTQYINSLLSGKLNMMKMELGINTTGVGNFIGYYKPPTYFSFVDGAEAVRSTNGGVISGATIPTNTYIELELSGDSSGQKTVKMNDELLVSFNIGSSHATNDYPSNIKLFAALDYDGIVYSYFKGKMYYFRVYDTDHTTLLYDFVPCYRKADSVAGLFDRISKTFYTNSGSGTFIVGGDV